MCILCKQATSSHSPIQRAGNIGNGLKDEARNRQCKSSTKGDEQERDSETVKASKFQLFSMEVAAHLTMRFNTAWWCPVIYLAAHWLPLLSFALLRCCRTSRTLTWQPPDAHVVFSCTRHSQRRCGILSFGRKKGLPCQVGSLSLAVALDAATLGARTSRLRLLNV